MTGLVGGLAVFSRTPDRLQAGSSRSRRDQLRESIAGRVGVVLGQLRLRAYRCPRVESDLRGEKRRRQHEGLSIGVDALAGFDAVVLRPRFADPSAGEEVVVEPGMRG